APGRLVVARGLPSAAAASGSSRPQRRNTAIHSRAASVGGARPRRGDRRDRAGLDAGGPRCRCRAVAGGAGPRATGRRPRPDGAAAIGGRPRTTAGPGCLQRFDLGKGGEAMKAKPVPAADLVLLRHHLTALHLPTIKAECEPVARQCAQENLDYLGFLLRLCEQELADREQRACTRRLKAARFPHLKSLDDFDFTAQPSLNRALVVELSRCAFIDQRESVILLGGPGTGKTHIAIGLAS